MCNFRLVPVGVAVVPVPLVLVQWPGTRTGHRGPRSTLFPHCEPPTNCSVNQRKPVATLSGSHELTHQEHAHAPLAASGPHLRGPSSRRESSPGTLLVASRAKRYLVPTARFSSPEPGKPPQFDCEWTGCSRRRPGNNKAPPPPLSCLPTDTVPSLSLSGDWLGRLGGWAASFLRLELQCRRSTANKVPHHQAISIVIVEKRPQTPDASSRPQAP